MTEPIDQATLQQQLDATLRNTTRLMDQIASLREQLAKERELRKELVEGLDYTFYLCMGDLVKDYRDKLESLIKKAKVL